MNSLTLEQVFQQFRGNKNNNNNNRFCTWILKCFDNMSQDDNFFITQEELVKIQNNDPIALQAIGNRYHMHHNFTRSLEWYLRSASINNNPHACCMIGLQYMMGQGVPVDYQKTMEWHLKAANQGISNAQYRVARLTETGYGTHSGSKQDSLEWYHKSMDSGYAEAYGDISRLNNEGYFLNTEQTAKLAMEKRIQQSERLCEEVESENLALNERIKQLEQIHEKANDMRKALKKERKKRRKQKKMYNDTQFALGLYLVALLDREKRKL